MLLLSPPHSWIYSVFEPVLDSQTSSHLAFTQLLTSSMYLVLTLSNQCLYWPLHILILVISQLVTLYITKSCNSMSIPSSTREQRVTSRNQMQLIRLDWETKKNFHFHDIMQNCYGHANQADSLSDIRWMLTHFPTCNLLALPFVCLASCFCIIRTPFRDPDSCLTCFA